jgi:hypothetical protein
MQQHHGKKTSRTFFAQFLVIEYIVIITIYTWTCFVQAATTITVDAQENIFVAGGNATIGTGSLDGLLPTEITLPAPTNQILTFTSVTDQVGCNLPGLSDAEYKIQYILAGAQIHPKVDNFGTTAPYP